MNEIVTSNWDDVVRFMQQNPQPRLLEPGEIARAKADQAAKAKHHRNKPGPKAESLAKYFYGTLGIALKKQSVETGLVDKMGNPIRKSIDVDFAGDVRINGHAQMFKTEIKGVTSGSLPLAKISSDQRKYLNRAVGRGAIAVLTIVWWTRVDPRLDETVVVLFSVPWADWLHIEETLRSKAKGNYRGNSFRTVDLPLLEAYGILKVNGRWSLRPEHWLYQMIRQQEESKCQVSLL